MNEGNQKLNQFTKEKNKGRIQKSQSKRDVSDENM